MVTKIDAFLSPRGKTIVYPRQGLLLQGQEASKTKINATVGVAYDDQHQHLCYSYLRQAVPGLSSAELVGYASSFGLEPLRRRWQELLVQKNPSLAAKTFSLPVVTAGITNSLAVAAYLFSDQGTPLLLPHLFWPNYRLLFAQGHGADLRLYQTFADGGYNLAGLEQELAAPEPHKVVLLNCPNNPTGYSLRQDEVEVLASLLRRHAEAGQKIVLLCDDAYFGLGYSDEIATETIFAQLADLHPNVLVVKHDGVTKEEFGWGLRVGFITFAGAGLEAGELAALEDKAGAVLRASVSNVSRLSQELVLRVLSEQQHLHEQRSYRQLIAARYRRIRVALSAQEGKFFRLLPCNSGYFIALELKEDCAEQLRHHLIKHYNTGIIAFGSRYIRLAFSTVSEDDLDQLAKNIFAACGEVFTEMAG